MSKKVVRLTESQLRLMINKVINEQKTPVGPQKTKPQQVPEKPQINNNPENKNDSYKLLLQEALTYASKNIFTYVSKFKPGYIAFITNENDRNVAKKAGSLLDVKNQGASNLPGSHQIFLKFIQVSKEKKRNEANFWFVLSVTQPNAVGTYVENSIPFQQALDLLNGGNVTIEKADDQYSGVKNEGPGELLYQLNWAAGLTTEQAFQMMRRVVPDIYGSVINDLVNMEYHAETREQKNYLQAAMKTIESIMGQQQQPVNENKKRRV